MTERTLTLAELEQEIEVCQSKIDQQHRQIHKGMDALEKLGKYLGQLEVNKQYFLAEIKKQNEEKPKEATSDGEPDLDRTVDPTD